MFIRSLDATKFLALAWLTTSILAGQTKSPALVRPPMRLPATSSNAQDQLDSNQALFTVMAAINLAGYDDQINAVSSHPFRHNLRTELGTRKLQSVIELKRFFKDRGMRDPNAELSRYISYGLLINGPPDFSYRDPDMVRPPDATALEGLSPLLAAFYKEANLEQQWNKAQPFYEEAFSSLHQPLTRLVLETTAYLRNAANIYLGRRFQIYVDLLGAPNQVQTRSYGDEYFVVVTPSAEPQLDRVRHAYLHFIVDPLGLKYGEDIKKKKPLGDYAQGAPALPENYKENFGDLAVECVIKGLESRLDRKPAMVEEALKEGYVLTPALTEQLALYEKQDAAFRIYFPNLFAALDFKKEEQRLSKVEFTAASNGRLVRAAQNNRPPELVGQAKLLAEADQLYSERNLGQAKQAYLKVLEGPDEQNGHAKSYYGLARVAVLERDPETGDRLFRKVLELGPDAATKSWSLLYLARLADSQGQHEQALGNYRAALAVEGVPDGVRQAAEKGLVGAFSK